MEALDTSLPGGTWTLGDSVVTRFGYGAMQLAGPGAMGSPPTATALWPFSGRPWQPASPTSTLARHNGPRITKRADGEALRPYPTHCSSPRRWARRATLEAGGPSPDDQKRFVGRCSRTFGPWGSSSRSRHLGRATRRARNRLLAESFGTLFELQKEV